MDSIPGTLGFSLGLQFVLNCHVIFTTQVKLQVNVVERTAHVCINQEINGTRYLFAIFFISDTGYCPLGALEVELRVQHLSGPGDGAALGDVKVLLGNERRRVAQVAALDGVGTRQVVTTGKIHSIFESAAAVDGGSVLTILREESIDFCTLLHFDIGQDIESTASLARNHNGCGCRMVEVGECHHILVNRRRELRDIILHHIGDVRAWQQRGIGTDAHDVSHTLDGGGDIGKALSEDLCYLILLAVHKLNLTSIGTQVDDHIVQVTQVNRSVDGHRAAVGSDEFIVIEGDDVILDRNAVGSKLQRTAVARQVDRCRIGGEIAVNTGIIGRARYRQITHCIAVKPNVIARNECIGT